MKLITRLLSLITGCLLVVSALADTPQSGKETFENYPGSSNFRRNGSTQLNAGPLRLDGGQTLTGSGAFPPGTVYATIGAVYGDWPKCEVSLPCTNCGQEITIRSEQAFQYLVVDILQANVPVLN